jgi:hypothetical protein
MSSPVYACDPEGYREVKLEASGFGARAPQTVPEAFKGVVKKFPDRPAMAVKRAPKDVSIG